MLTEFPSCCSYDDPLTTRDQELYACQFQLDAAQDPTTRPQLFALVGFRLWLVDPKLWDDKKFLSLNGTGRQAWICILTGCGRTALPGLTTNFNALTLASSLRYEVSECTFAIRDLLDREMVDYDPDVRVLRVPRAPQYSICRNPNMLAGWFRLWNNVPDCALKFNHVGSLAECINFANESMVERWDRSFGRIQHRLGALSDPTALPRVPMLDRMLGSHPPAAAPPEAMARLEAPKLNGSKTRAAPSKVTRGEPPLPTSCFTTAKRKRGSI